MRIQVVVLATLFALTSTANGQSTDQVTPQNGPQRDYQALLSRLDAQEAELQRLKQRLEAADRPLYQAVTNLGARDGRTGQPGVHFATAGPVCNPSKDEVRRLPVVVDHPVCQSKSCQGKNLENFQLRFYCDYDKGFVIRPIHRDRHPFEIKINGWIQFRHVAFARDVASWTDSTGTTRPVFNRNDFDIERGRLVFSGYALTPQLTYFLQLDGDTEGRETVDFFDYWWGYRFSDALRFQVGKRKVPGSEQWLLGARRTRLVDRPMSNDFFRPDRTVGIFAVGDLGSFHYEAMAGNGIRTSNLGAADLNNKMAFATSAYWDPFGKFGNRLTDYPYSQDPLARLGGSFTYGPQSGLANGLPLGESDFVRLTDGTRLTATGALAPNVKVTSFDVYLLSIDAATRWRGCSFNAEIFLRWLQSLRGDGPLPFSDIFQRGFYVEGGKFLIRDRLDVNARYAQIDGPFGNASEISVGFNWFPMDTPRLKCSFNVADIRHSPLNNTSSEILVGDDGRLFRTQFQAEF